MKQPDNHKYNRIIAVGDIHGDLTALETLIDRIDPTEEDLMIFLGDYVDFGPDSFDVVETVIDLKDAFPQTVTLCGEHEDFIRAMLMGNQDEQDRHLWLHHNGGQATIDSYRNSDEFLIAHRAFYMNLTYRFETWNHFFCHAGIRIDLPLATQRDMDLVEAGEIFLRHPGPYEKIIVHGHHVIERIERLPHRINLDTGAGKGGFLTAMDVVGGEIFESR